MNPAPSNYSSFFKTLKFEGIKIGIILDTKEGAG